MILHDILSYFKNLLSNSSIERDPEDFIVKLENNPNAIAAFKICVLAIKQKTEESNKNVLLPIMQLVYCFENNGIPEEHAEKLNDLFDTPMQALAYLLKFYERKIESNKKEMAEMYKNWVHDACLFTLPSKKGNFKKWQNFSNEHEFKNMFNPMFMKTLQLSVDLEQHITDREKKIKEEIKNEIEEKKKETPHRTVLEIRQEIKKLKEQALEKINQKIATYNQICKNYETNPHADRKNPRIQDEYREALKKRSVARAERLDYYFYSGGNFKTFNIEMLMDSLEHYSNNFEAGKVLQYFLKWGIPMSKYKIFLGLNRENAGKNIPEILIDGKDLGFSGYYLKKLNVQNELEAAKGACLGKLTKCCQSLSGEAGESCVIHGLTDPDGGFYVLCRGYASDPKLEHEVLAQSWAWRSKSGALVLDSVEHKQLDNVDKHIHSSIISAFYDALAQELSLPEYAISKTMLGWGGNTPNELMQGKVNYSNPRIVAEKISDNYIGYTDSRRQILLNSSCPLFQINCLSDFNSNKSKILKWFQEKLNDEVPAILTDWVEEHIIRKTDLSVLAEVINIIPGEQQREEVNNFYEKTKKLYELVRSFNKDLPSDKKNSIEEQILELIAQGTNYSIRDEELQSEIISENSDEEKVRLLIKLCASEVKVLGSPAIYWAAEDERWPIVALLIKGKKNVNFKEDRGTLFSLIIRSNGLTVAEKLQMIKLAITEGEADVNIADEYNQTPLFLIVKSNQLKEEKLEMIEFLITKGHANVNSSNGLFRETPLDCANQEKVATLLLKHGAIRSSSLENQLHSKPMKNIASIDNELARNSSSTNRKEQLFGLELHKQNLQTANASSDASQGSEEYMPSEASITRKP